MKLDLLEDLAVDGMIILKLILRDISCGSEDALS
jgi:hypothetical protein